MRSRVYKILHTTHVNTYILNIKTSCSDSYSVNYEKYVQNGCAQYVGLVTSDYLGVVLGVAAGILLLQVISTNIHELYTFLT
jgi:hypothetical protein